MFSEYKNSYLQLVCAVNPRVINKAVDRAMWYKRKDMRDEIPPAQYLESMQPSLYAPMTDVTRVQMGFERVGLRVLNRELSSRDSFIQLQAIHSILDQVQISENAMFLINLNVVYHLIELMHVRDPIVREKVCMILSILATYYQGRKRILASPVFVTNLMFIIMRDRKEIRYAAANTLLNLLRDHDRCAIDQIIKTPKVVENLLKMVKDEHSATVLIHLKSLCTLCEWDPEPALRANAFQVMFTLFSNFDTSVVAKAMEVMMRLCKHEIGKQLADNYDLTHYLMKKHLHSTNMRVIISTTGLMLYTTQTTRAKWRIREFAGELTQRLVSLARVYQVPHLQVRAIRVLIILCDSPDIRGHLKQHWEKKIGSLKILTHEQWNGTSKHASHTKKEGHQYRTVYIEGIETIKNDYGDNENVINVHSYLRTLQDAKAQLIKAINIQPHKD